MNGMSFRNKILKHFARGDVKWQKQFIKKLNISPIDPEGNGRCYRLL